MAQTASSDNPSAEALLQAAASGDAADIKQLIADGANPDARDRTGSPVLQALMLRKDPRGFRIMLDAGADPAAPASNGNTALHLAAMLDEPDWLQTLLQTGISTDIRNADTGETPLFSALEARRAESIRILLDAGADPHARTAGGATLLHKAARISAGDWVVFFLEAGVDPTAVDHTGHTFQPSFFRPRVEMLGAQALQHRQHVRQWLGARDITVESDD